MEELATNFKYTPNLIILNLRCKFHLYTIGNIMGDEGCKFLFLNIKTFPTLKL